MRDSTLTYQEMRIFMPYKNENGGKKNGKI